MQYYLNRISRRQFLMAFIVTVTASLLILGLAVINSSARSALSKSAVLPIFGGQYGAENAVFVLDGVLRHRGILRGILPYVALALELLLRLVSLLAGLVS